jgi:diaminopimelate decarboxylase
MHLDSLTQVEQFGKHFPERHFVRLNLGVGAGHHSHVITGGPESKFGIDAANIEELNRSRKNTACASPASISISAPIFWTCPTFIESNGCAF